MATVHYLREWYPGLWVSESSTEKVKNRDHKAAMRNIGDRCYAFEFFDREEIEKDGKTLIGPEENRSPTYFPGGRMMSLKEVKRELPDKEILISNMERNRTKQIVRNRFGGFIEHRDPVCC